MGFRFLGIVCIFAIGCGESQNTSVEIAPELQTSVQNFIDEGKDHEKSISQSGLHATITEDIPLTTEGVTPYGVCIRHSDGLKEVRISKSFYENADASMRELVIYHELGHCLLNRVHEDSIYSVMYPTPDLVYFKFTEMRSQYLAELFESPHQPEQNN